MKVAISVCVAGLLGLSLPIYASSEERPLSLEERIRAQEALERVYYRHQLGATARFEDAVTHAFLEKKVRSYLKQSLALERSWKTPITPSMLREETERMARETRLPDRLRELFAALHDDPFLIQECLARPVLADRLARNFFAYDSSIHADKRLETERLRKRLVRGEIDPSDEHPDRAVVEFTRSRPGGPGPRRVKGDAGRRQELAPEQFDKWRAGLPRVGQIGPLMEELDAFVVRVVLEDRSDRLRVAIYRIPKITWDEWWERVHAGLREESVRPVGDRNVPVPRPEPRSPEGRSARGCLQSSMVAGPAPNVASCTDDSWINDPPYDPPDPRDGHTAVWTGSVMVVWGGLVMNTGGRYDPATDTWTPTSMINAPTARGYHAAVWTGTSMVIWGGLYYDTNDARALWNTGGRYDPVTDVWTPISSTGAPSARYYHTATWTGGLMVVWGGFDDSSALATGGRYNPTTDSWTPISAVNAPMGRYYHSSVWTGSQVIVWGGYDNTSVLRTGGRYSPTTDTWTPTSLTGAPSYRSGHTATWTGSEMLVWGGYSIFGITNTGGRYDPASDTWGAISTSNAPSVRSGHSVVWTGTRMIVWGGANDTTNTTLNTGGRYDPTTDTWSATSTLNAPRLENHPAIWTGSVMVVWGGRSALNGEIKVLAKGGRYDPASDTWTPTAALRGPTDREVSSVVWTGNLVVVWGGASQGEFVNTGGRYDPAIDSWSPTSTLNAPSPRSAAAPAVWTGNRMMVWGGLLGEPAATGGRYDPVTDAWAPISATNAPSPRQDHTIVWTGTRAIVWGGWDGTSELSTGGQYDPIGDAWASTSTVNAPVGRQQHVAVWTGGAMMVWGGATSASNTDTGGLYDPSSDTWTPTTSNRAPSARVECTAVWTGTVVVVWGGTDDIRVLDTGGVYDPAQDAWRSTSRTNAPSARIGHSAVWADDRMIVWGGSDFTNYFDTGARYDPVNNAWTPTPTSQAPYARGYHMAVWTGDLMLIWGGDASWGVTGSGGRYCTCKLHYLDADGDGYGDPSVSIQACGLVPGYAHNAVDCNDSDSGSWSNPTEVPQLRFTNSVTLEWLAPVNGGASSVFYDLLRSNNSDDFVTASCVASDTGMLSTQDAAIPTLNSALYYLVRAQNYCPDGTGPLGSDSSGTLRTGRTCP